MRIRLAPTIVFPGWVKSTHCEWRTFSVVIPNGDPHGALRIEKTHYIGKHPDDENPPVIPRIGG